MINNKVTLAFSNREFLYTIPLDRYEFTCSKLAKLIKKYLLKFKLIKGISEPQYGYKEYTFDFGKLDAGMLHEIIDMYWLTNHTEGKTLYIGRKQLAQLLQDPRVSESSFMERPFTLGIPKTMMGLEVVVVPYMDGVLIV